MNIGKAKVTYTKFYDENLIDVTSIKAEIVVPATDGDVEGFVTLGAIDGWTLSENDTKLSKTYSVNTTEVITITLVGFNGQMFENVTTMKAIDVYGINASDYVRSKVDYVAEGRTITTAIVTLEIKEDKNYLFEELSGWQRSEDKKKLTSNVTVNHNYEGTCIIYPSNETHTAENERQETFSYSVDKINLTVGTPVVTHTLVGEGKTIAEVISVAVPYTIDTEEGYAVVEKIEGWTLSDSNTKLNKTYYENGEETINIHVLSCDGFTFDNLYIEASVTVDKINYKEVVKGICEDSRCLYDVYTKEEVDSIKLQLEEEIRNLKMEMDIWKM